MKAACVALAAFAMAVATLTPYTAAQDSRQEFLDPHNAARAAVGVGPVSWDDRVAAYARNYAAQRQGDCALQHSSNSPYGENIAMSTGDMSVRDAVGLWVNERQWYRRDGNSCSAPMGQSCLHYTQVVWRNTNAIGCARVRCNGGGTFVICSYSPPGNYVGQPPY